MSVLARSDALVEIDSSAKPRKSRLQTGQPSMRGLLMALFAFDFPGHRPAGGAAARLSSTKTTAKKTTATTV